MEEEFSLMSSALPLQQLPSHIHRLARTPPKNTAPCSVISTQTRDSNLENFKSMKGKLHLHVCTIGC